MLESNQDAYLDGVGPDPAQEEGDRRTMLLQRIDALGQELAKTRSAAIEGRQASGIEATWIEDEEFYEGIDDANRDDQAAWRSKPLGRGGMETGEGRKKPTGSTVFPNITRPYVDAFAARCADMLLPTDDVSWSIGPTPVPELIPISENKIPNKMYQQVLRERGNDKAQAEMAIAQLVEQAKAQMEQAKETADRAQKRIQDWHIECQYHSHVRAQIEDAAKVGVGVLKGPVPVLKKVAAYRDGQLVIQEEIKPVSMRIDYWNLFPDPACGSDIHKGSYIWERDDITRRMVEDLKGDPNYISEQIDECLKEGPHQACSTNSTKPDENGLKQRDNKDLFEIWYYHGSCKKHDFMTAMELTQPPEAMSKINADEIGETLYIQLTMINNRVIRIAQNPIDTGDFPYDVLPCQQRKDHWAGIGIARQIRTAQRIVTAAWRAMMDNAGRASGPMVLFDPSIVQPADHTFTVEAWKFFMLTNTLDSKEALDNAFRFLKIDMMQAELAAIIEMGLRLAEDATGLPMIMQGQTNSATPTTLGGMQIQNNNASTVLRRFARLCDDRVTEPHVRRYYNWLLIYGEDNEKGDFVINAMGSSALVERELQSQQIIQLIGMFQNPMFKKDPAKGMDELLKSMRLDPSRFDYTDEDWKQIVQQISQPQQSDSSVQVAQLRADVDKLRITSAENIAAYKEEQATLRQREKQEFELLLNQLDQDVIAYQEQMEKGNNDASLKTRMAETVLKLKAQIGMNRQALAPPTEPAGRAPNGQAFQR